MNGTLPRHFGNHISVSPNDNTLSVIVVLYSEYYQVCELFISIFISLLDVLPNSVDLPLYFKREDLDELQGSHVLCELYDILTF